MRPRLAAACAPVLLLLGPTAAHAGTWTVRAPGDGLRVLVRTTEAGKATLRVQRGGRVVLRADAGRLPGRVRVRARRTPVDQRFSTPAGKRRVHRLRARRLVLDGAGRHRVEVLAAPDGVALRLRGAGRAEPTTFRAPKGSRAWLQRYTAASEDPYVERAPRRARGRFGVPALLRTPQGTATLLTESGLRPGDGSAHLVAARDGLRFAPPNNTRSPDRTPWRVAVVGSLATVVGSDLPLALGRPSRVRDTSWIRPGRAAWSWWASSFSTFDPVRLRDYDDLAARNGWEYQVLDARWRPEQLPGVVADATGRGVRSLLWFDADELDTPAKRERVLDEVARLGFAGVKVDYLLSDRPARVSLMDAIAADAARRRLVVTFHGATAPRGLQRTWPNVLTVEAVRGAEHSRGDDPGPSAAQAVDLVFTRNAIGSMDYTPVTSSARNRTTTDGHELAKAVVFESGLQTYADTPEAYAARPAAEAVLREVPAAWDDTRLVAGAPGRLAAVARRTGATWWLGVLGAGAASTSALPLHFLPDGRTFTATVTHDDLSQTELPVTSATVLRERVGVDGGLVVRISG